MEYSQDATSPVKPWHLTPLILSETSVAYRPLSTYNASFSDFLPTVFPRLWPVLKEFIILEPWYNKTLLTNNTYMYFILRQCGGLSQTFQSF